MQIALTVKKQIMTAEADGPIVAGSVGVVQCTASFDAAWDGMDLIKIVFTGNGTCKEIEWKGEAFFIPWETIRHPGRLLISAIGYGEGVHYPTAELEYPLKIMQSGDVHGGSGEPSPESLVYQAREAAMEAARIAKALEDKFNGVSGGGSIQGPSGPSGEEDKPAEPGPGGNGSGTVDQSVLEEITRLSGEILGKIDDFSSKLDDFSSNERLLPVINKKITENGIYLPHQDGAALYNELNVEVAPKVEEAVFEENGVYTPSDGFDGFSRVEVQVSGSGGKERICEPYHSTINGAFYISNGEIYTDSNTTYGMALYRVEVGGRYILYCGSRVGPRLRTAVFEKDPLTLAAGSRGSIVFPDKVEPESYQAYAFQVTFGNYLLVYLGVDHTGFDITLLDITDRDVTDAYPVEKSQ